MTEGQPRVTNDVNLNIRIPEAERDSFNHACRQEGLSQAEVLRRLINAYTAGRIKVHLTVSQTTTGESTDVN